MLLVSQLLRNNGSVQLADMLKEHAAFKEVDGDDRKKDQTDRERNAAILKRNLSRLRILLEQRVTDASVRTTKSVHDALTSEPADGEIHDLLNRLESSGALKDRHEFGNQTISSLFENIDLTIHQLDPMATWGEKWIEKGRVEKLEKHAKEIDLEDTIARSKQKHGKAGFSR